MANFIYQSRDCDVYCLELDELDGLQIVVKGHKYDSVNKDLNDHNGNISNTEPCIIQSAQNFKYFPSISQAEKLKGGVKNITIQTTPSNTKQMERRGNQLQRCLFTNNRPATHLQPEIHVNKKPYACNLCDKSYSWRTSLSFHKRIHTGQKIQQCIECDKKFRLNCRYEKHLKTHKKEKTYYTCSICDRKFQHKSSLKYHFRTHEIKPYSCRICEQEYRYRASFKNHMRLQHQCSENKPRINRVSSDTTMIKSTQSYKCSMCEKQFSHDSNLCAHLKIHEWCQNVKSSTNGDNILTLPSTSITTSATQQMCSIVPKTTLPSTGVIANTIQRSSSIANTTVGSSLTPKNLFDQEITQCLPLLDSEIMPTTLENFVDHKTTKCLPLLDSKVMPTTPENFVNHETTHYVPPVDLKNMSDSLSNSGGLNNPRASSNVNTQPSVSSNVNQKHHSTRHSFGSNIYSSSTHLSDCVIPRRPNIKPRPTCVGCNMTQPTSGINCNTTVSSNSGRRDVHSKCQAATNSSECNKGKKLSSLRNYLDRPYNCSTCLSRFIRKYDLDRHMRMHSGDKPYQCQDCGKKFPENYRLQSHRKRHKSSYQSECPVCGKLFLKHLTLKTHLKIHKWRESI